MNLRPVLVASAIVLSSCSHSYYVVRHAEKEAPGPQMVSDVPLTEAGEQRAAALRDRLRDKRIRYVFSTNTLRTRSTAAPTATLFGLPVTIYQPAVPDAAFLGSLKSLKKNVLIVGHSNTVDNIVNGLTGQQSVPGDLGDNEYNHLFVVTVKGKKVIFRDEKIYPDR